MYPLTSLYHLPLKYKKLRMYILKIRKYAFMSGILLLRNDMNLLFFLPQYNASCGVNYAILTRSMRFVDCSRHGKLKGFSSWIFGAMPFLKPQRATWCERRTEACKRNGWRHAIYSPEAKRIAKAHYKGEWRNDKREGKGIGINRCREIYVPRKFPRVPI